MTYGIQMGNDGDSPKRKKAKPKRKRVWKAWAVISHERFGSELQHMRTVSGYAIFERKPDANRMRSMDDEDRVIRVEVREI